MESLEKNELRPFLLGQLMVSLRERPSSLGEGEELLLEVLAPGLGADRSYVGGWVFGLNQRDVAERLQRCIEAGKAYRGYKIGTDVNGQTYISAETTGFFHKRHMKSELAKLGF